MKRVIEHKNIIFGLGQSGMSCVHYFERTGVSYSLVDTREDPPNKDKLSQLKNCQAMYFGVFDNEILNSCNQLIVSPGISQEHPFICEAKNRNIDICGDIELFARNYDKKIVAITGSNGKSTVTELTESLISASGLNVQKAGNIGLPVLDYLASTNASELADVFVLELSSFQLDLTKNLKADVAVLLNVSEDHMDRYTSFDDYISSKKSIFNGAKKRVFNLDDERIYPSEIYESDYAFSLNESVQKVECKIARIVKNHNNYNFLLNNNKTLDSKNLNIAGKHNLSNVLVSLSILELLNIKINKEVRDALSAYSGMEHRFQLVAKQFNCSWVNDSKATNVGATLAALDGFESNKKQRLILIAGGDSKQSDLKPLRKAFEDKVDSLILLGKDAKSLANLSQKITSYFVVNMQQAVDKAKSIIDSVSINKQTTVLLSPACASQDMFKNFEDRGEQFIRAIEVLK